MWDVVVAPCVLVQSGHLAAPSRLRHHEEIHRWYIRKPNIWSNARRNTSNTSCAWNGRYGTTCRDAPCRGEGPWGLFSPGCGCWRSVGGGRWLEPLKPFLPPQHRTRTTLSWRPAAQGALSTVVNEIQGAEIQIATLPRFDLSYISCILVHGCWFKHREEGKKSKNVWQCGPCLSCETGRSRLLRTLWPGKKSQCTTKACRPWIKLGARGQI